MDQGTRQNFSTLAFVGGITLVVALYFVGLYISETAQISDISESSTFLWVVIFIGLSVGHYLGRAATTEGDKLNSFLLGTSLSISVGLLLGIGLTPLSGVLVFLAVSIFLMHRSGLVKDHENIEILVNLFARYIPAIVLPITGLWHYIVPLLTHILGA